MQGQGSRTSEEDAGHHLGENNSVRQKFWLPKEAAFQCKYWSKQLLSQALIISVSRFMVASS